MKFTKMLEERKQASEAKRQREQEQQAQEQAAEAAANPLRAYLRMLLQSAVAEVTESEQVPLQLRPMVSVLTPMLTAASSRLTEEQARAIARGIVHFADTQLKPMLEMFPEQPAIEAQAIDAESRAIN